jgi:ATP-dependent DNA helicase RecG
MGTGIARIRHQLNEAGLPPAEYHFSNFVKVVFHRLSQGRKKGSEKSSEKSSEKILRIIKEHPEISAREIAEVLRISSRSVEKHIALLRKRSLLRRIGSAKGGRWEIIG